MQHPAARSIRASLGGPLTPVVKVLIIINIVVYLSLQITAIPIRQIYDLLGLTPQLLIEQRALWQLASYMFIHDVNWFHILFNMLVLWWLGCDLERVLGSSRFIRFYLMAGIFAALSVVALQSTSNAVTIGASGAMMALLTLFGCLYPNRPVLFMFVLPMPAKYLVMILIAMEVVAGMGNIQDNVSHIAHLGGAFFGVAWFLIAFGKLRFATWQRLIRRKFRRGKLKLIHSNQKEAEKKTQQPPTIH